MTRVARGPVALFVLIAVSLSPRAAGVDETAQRLKAWRADLEYLYEEIEKPASLRAIFKVKGIEWKKVKKEADRRFRQLSKEASRRRGKDPLADQVAFYDLLRFVVGQLRDSHAHVQVEESITAAWKASQEGPQDVGIELQPGTHDTIIVSNTFAARGANSPLHARGVRHDATLLESIDGVPAAKYLAEKAREKFEDEGWQSTPGRASIEALNGLQVPADGKIELVFRELDMPEAARRSYVELDARKRKKAFKSLKWKTKKVSLRATECTRARNPRNFRFLALELPELEKTADPRIWYGRLESGFGYVRYGAVSGTSRKGLEEACQALADTPGLILDLRLNGGGGESGIEVFDRKDGAWDRPLAVLIGPKAMSAAETELWTLLQMRSNKRCNARLFGRTTAGSSGDKIRFELPSGFAKGQFVYRHWHGGRSTIEGAGIEPDEVVDQDVVELSLGIDSCIRAAEEWLESESR